MHVPSPAPTSPLPRGLVLALATIATAAFMPTLAGGFLGDDFVYIARFWGFSWSEWPRLFVHEWSEGLWGVQLKELRPFAALSFMIDSRLWGDWAPGYRLTNLALHVAVVLLVARLAWRYTGGSLLGTGVAGLVFAFHPTHAEPVAWITGRVDVLATVCALGFWLAAEDYVDGRWPRGLVVGIAVLFVGLFSKELALTAPLLLLLRWLAFDARASREVWRRRAFVLAGVLALIGVYAIARHVAFGAAATSGGSSWSDAGSWARQASYLGWLAPWLPFAHLHEWPVAAKAETMRVAWSIAAGVIGVASGWAIWRRAVVAGNVLFFGGLWYLVAVGGLLVVGYFSPRHLYFPSTGLAIAAGVLIGGLASWPKLRLALGVTLVAWCGAAHGVALQPWRENGHISRACIRALNTEAVANRAPGTLLLVAVPETLRTAWLWSWASPQAFGAPFLERPFAPSEIIERAGNYYRPDSWVADRQPLAAVRTAPAAVALVLDEQRRPRLRAVPGPELRERANALALIAGDGITPEEWTSWVTDLTRP